MSLHSQGRLGDSTNTPLHYIFRDVSLALGQAPRPPKPGLVEEMP